MSKKTVHPKWTTKEDNVVIEAVQKSIANKQTLKSAFIEASKQIDRTIGSISFRWNSKLKLQQQTHSQDISHSDIINYLDNLTAQNNNLKEKYNALYLAHQKLLSNLSTSLEKTS